MKTHATLIYLRVGTTWTTTENVLKYSSAQNYELHKDVDTVAPPRFTNNGIRSHKILAFSNRKTNFTFPGTRIFFLNAY